MTAPRKKKKRGTGRPLENVPIRKLIRSVKEDIEVQIAAADKPERD